MTAAGHRPPPAYGHPYRPPDPLGDDVRAALADEVRRQLRAARLSHRLHLTRRSGLACGATAAGGSLIISELSYRHLVPAAAVILICAVVVLCWMLALDDGIAR